MLYLLLPGDRSPGGIYCSPVQKHRSANEKNKYDRTELRTYAQDRPRVFEAYEKGLLVIMHILPAVAAAARRKGAIFLNEALKTAEPMRSGITAADVSGINLSQSVTRPAMTADSGKIFKIATDRIIPNPSQPRKLFDEDAIIRLADSIRRYGLLQPISVRRLALGGPEGGKYEIIAGERRYRAAKLLGMDHIPCMIISADSRTAAELALIENVQREGLTMFEQAGAIAALIDIYRLTQEQIAVHLSSSQSYVANKLRLLKLSQRERELITEGHLTERHARAFLRMTDPDERIAAIEHVITRGMNVSATEEYIDRKLCMLPEQPDERNTRKRKLILKDMRLFYNTIDKAIDIVRQSGVDVKSERRVSGDGGFELIIKINPPC